jgi:hypothetical protein
MDFQFINGPMNWFHFEIVDDLGRVKQVHLFADIHDFTNLCPQSFRCKRSKHSKSKCLEFDYFLELVFQNAFKNKEYTDFFLESPYRLQQRELVINPGKNYLDLINQRFEKCLMASKKTCKYLPYIRMHYTDVRIPDYHYITIGSFVGQIYYHLIDAVVMYGTNKISKEELVEFVELFYWVTGMITSHAKEISLIMMTENNFESKIEKIFEPFFRSKQKGTLFLKLKTKMAMMIRNLFALVKVRNGTRTFIVKHQLDKLRRDNVKFDGKNIADLILSFFVEFSEILSLKAQLLNREFWKDLNLIEKVKNLDPKDAMDLANQLYQLKDQILTNNILFDLTYLDAYILARMFRVFGKTNYSEQAIVYAGNLHIQSQKDFFEIFLGLSPIHVESNREGQRCLSNSEFHEIFLH